MNCPSCGAQVDCGCQLVTKPDGKQGCKKCVVPKSQVIFNQPQASTQVGSKAPVITRVTYEQRN